MRRFSDRIHMTCRAERRAFFVFLASLFFICMALSRYPEHEIRATILA